MSRALSEEPLIGLKDPSLLTLREVMDLLDVSDNTVRSLVKKGLLAPPIRQSRHWVRYRIEDVRQYIDMVRAGDAANAAPRSDRKPYV